MKKINSFFYILLLDILFYSLLLGNNVFWEPVHPEKNDVVTIFIDTSNDSNYSLSYPMYIHFNENNSFLTKTMQLDYLMGPSVWSYSIVFNNKLTFIINNSSSPPKTNVDNIYNIETNNTITNIFEKALFYLNKKDYYNAIKEIYIIISTSEDLYISSQAEYMLAEIYLNDFNNYQLSANILNNIINKYPEKLNAVKKSYFTLAYIYSNYLDYYSESLLLYNKFLSIYPNDELIESINYELDLLSKVNATIDSLLNTSK